jgi:hypothetical protein
MVTIKRQQIKMLPPFAQVAWPASLVWRILLLNDSKSLLLKAMEA